MANRHLRIRIDLAVPLPDSFAGDTVAGAFAALPAAVRTRLIALRDTIRAAKADSEKIGWEDTVSTKIHLCNHNVGQPCPPDVDV
jgi:hypothetical protein